MSRDFPEVHGEGEHFASVTPIHEELTRSIVNETYRTEPIGENARTVRRECAEHDYQPLEICVNCGVARETL